MFFEMRMPLLLAHYGAVRINNIIGSKEAFVVGFSQGTGKK